MEVVLRRCNVNKQTSCNRNKDMYVKDLGGYPVIKL
jgi:hypothetical protein